MNKHIKLRIEQSKLLSSCSPCPRGKHGAVIINEQSNTVLSDGYNGSPRGGGTLCGGDVCARAKKEIPSGTEIQIGCHHAEMNAICNAARNGVSTEGASIIITGEPCLMCAKLIHHSGLKKIYYISGGYTTSEGVDYLNNNGVVCELI